VLIPKDNGKMRKPGIPTVRDRVVQQALKNVLEPIFEEIFLLLRYVDNIVIFCNARKKGVEFLGFHFNGRWKRPRDKARKRFREEIRRRTRRQQPKNLEMVIKSINPVIRGWGNYFKCGTVKKLFGELDGYIRGHLRSFQEKKRTLKVLVFGIHPAEFAEMGLVSLSSMLDDTIT
jgi:RNA-directed DNA polymerase